jgi:hypothetical protein
MSQKSKKEKGLFEDNIFTVGMKNDKQMEQYLNPNQTADQSDLNLSAPIVPKDNELKNENDNENDLSNRTLGNRIFGKINPGSVRGSIFNLAILSLGAGCLALPQKIKNMSMIVTLIDIILAGFATYWTLNLLILSSKKYKIYNYSLLVRKIFGKGLSIFLDCVVLVYIFGVMVMYQVIGKKIYI